MSGWLADTSVAVPAIVLNHLAHDDCVEAIAERDVVLAAHSALETYSVLTRLPGDARLTPRDAAHAIAVTFGTPVALPSTRATGLVAELAVAGVAAGATYDALIGITAACAGRVLVTRDRRAAATYSLLNIAHELL